MRLEVEAVAPEVLADRRRGVAYVLRPMLVAVDLETGAERWRLPEVTGTALYRAGTSLVVVRGEGARGRDVAFVDPEKPSTARTCAVPVPAPVGAARVTFTPFARDGKVFVLWQSDPNMRRGGPPPGAEELARAEAARGCGVLAVDAARCATTPGRLEDFLLAPPRRAYAAVASAGRCRYLSPALDMPAVAASLARPRASGEGAGATLHVVIGELSPMHGPCGGPATATLEARSAKGEVVWRLPLADRIVERPCPGPP